MDNKKTRNFIAAYWPLAVGGKIYPTSIKAQTTSIVQKMQLDQMHPHCKN